jgi:hypothetical protein
MSEHAVTMAADDDGLVEIATQLRQNLEVKDRRYHMKSYKVYCSTEAIRPTAFFAVPNLWRTS